MIFLTISTRFYFILEIQFKKPLKLFSLKKIKHW